MGKKGIESTKESRMADLSGGMRMAISGLLFVAFAGVSKASSKIKELITQKKK